LTRQVEQDMGSARAISIRLNSARLTYELARRGWSCSDLAQAAGVSRATISAAIHGGGIRHQTLVRLAGALLRQPVMPEVEVILEPPGGQDSAERTLISAS